MKEEMNNINKYIELTWPEPSALKEYKVSLNTKR